jgi:hypothetical protein
VPEAVVDAETRISGPKHIDGGLGVPAFEAPPSFGANLRLAVRKHPVDQVTHRTTLTTPPRA